MVGSFALVDVAPGGASELRLDVAFSRSTEARHGCTLESSVSERSILFEAIASAARCADLPTAVREHAECDELCLVRQLGEDEPTCEEDGGPTYERELRLALMVEAGRARVALSSAVELTPPDGLLGDHTLDGLLMTRTNDPLVMW